ncbi:Methyl-accepting chemotaxis protein [hydrothermal vent metagenome]|uniref:Methyl-accepting chemotaxis protein n=1 Tax=hydrothermal vent metagenome TaxID=652676 RepID=A0A1W1CZ26_9ZZZZ
MKIFLVLALLLFNLQAKSLFTNNDQKDASKYLMAVKDLIVATQKTRGATVSYINGNDGALLLVYNFRDAMNKAIRKMNALPLANNPTISSQATSISSALVKLNSKAVKMSAEDAFDAYTEKISQALLLAQSVSAIGSKDMSAFGKKVSKIMMETILPLSEWMGELRALGSGAAAKGSASKKVKIKMQILVNKITKLEQKLQSQMQSIVSKNPDFFSVNTKMALSTAHRAIMKYIAVTKKYIIKDKVKYNPDEYFSLATDAISSIIVIFDADNTAINEDAKGWI